jgi:TRAP-type transport system periplasmic protein
MLRRMTGFALGLLAVVTAAAAQTTWDMPTPYPPSNFQTRNVMAFVDDVATATAGALRIKVHAGGAMAKHPEIKRTVSEGRAQIGEILTSVHADESPIYAVDSVPFLATSYADARKLYAAHRPLLEQRLAREGLLLLYSVPWPPQGLYAKKEIAALDMLKGLKFRTYNPGTRRIAELAGALPVQIEVPDLKAAFSEGRVDVTITSGATGVEARFWEFVTHYHDLQAWIPRNIVFARKADFEQLAPTQRTALIEAAGRAEERGWAASVRETEERVAALKAAGMIVIATPPALRDGLQSIGRIMTADWETAAGTEGKALLEAYRK